MDLEVFKHSRRGERRDASGSRDSTAAVGSAGRQGPPVQRVGPRSL